VGTYVRGAPLINAGVGPATYRGASASWGARKIPAMRMERRPKGRLYNKAGTGVLSPSGDGRSWRGRSILETVKRLGRPSPRRLYGRWQRLFESAECVALPSENERYGWVAERDWLEHPEDWPRNRFPASDRYEDAMSPREPYPARARRRVERGIKSL
jgi:hypothetical protein